MYDTSDIRKGLKVLMDGNPWVVVEFQFIKPGKGAAFTRTRFKNLMTGQVLEKNIRSGEKLEPADVEERKATFLYREGDHFVFMDSGSYEQVHVTEEVVSDAAGIMPDNIEVELLFWNDRPVGLTLPTFIELEVVEAEPGVRGDTATGATKGARVSTGATIAVPLFVNTGDVIRIDTRTGHYLERVRLG
jgi:elongation factor P